MALVIRVYDVVAGWDSITKGGFGSFSVDGTVTLSSESKTLSSLAYDLVPDAIVIAIVQGGP